jgi:hypothetical protein
MQSTGMQLGGTAVLFAATSALIAWTMSVDTPEARVSRCILTTNHARLHDSTAVSRHS